MKIRGSYWSWQAVAVLSFRVIGVSDAQYWKSLDRKFNLIELDALFADPVATGLLAFRKELSNGNRETEI